MDFTKPPLSTVLDVVRTNGLRVLVIVIVAVIALRITTVLVHGIVKALLDREATEGTAQELSAIEVQKRMDTLDELMSRVIRTFVVMIAFIMILGALDLDIGPAVAGLGVVGIAVGFGAQSLVRDYLNGALILIENQYSKGDVVSIAGVSGAVEDFSLRRTTLRDLDGIVHTVPNGEVKVASNRTRTWARINQNVTVAFGTDIDKAIQVVEELGQSMAA
ncbi:MAG: mechanosensitive ion channel family protein, partial [Chloroflexota bacterium]|nr:mechanosensitive ion channel family protein [Chloroflexota bacterium]